MFYYDLWHIYVIFNVYRRHDVVGVEQNIEVIVKKNFNFTFDKTFIFQSFALSKYKKKSTS